MADANRDNNSITSLLAVDSSDSTKTVAVEADPTTKRLKTDGISAGDVAHDAADSGKPVKMGAKATSSIEALTQVANNDRTDLYADLNGILISRPHTTLEEILSERVTDTAGNSTDFSTFAAGGSGVHNYVTTISIYNSSATDVFVDFRDGNAGSVIFTAPAPQTIG